MAVSEDEVRKVSQLARLAILDKYMDATQIQNLSVSKINTPRSSTVPTPISRSTVESSCISAVVPSSSNVCTEIDSDSSSDTSTDSSADSSSTGSLICSTASAWETCAASSSGVIARQNASRPRGSNRDAPAAVVNRGKTKKDG